MKSKTSFFNFHIFRKDIRRYYPLWLLFTIGMGMSILAMDLEPLVADGYVTNDLLLEGLRITALANAAYGSLCAITLFYDLFVSSRCNALHALPLKRDCWFVTHTLSGLCFGMVPYLGIIGLKMIQSPQFLEMLAYFGLGCIGQFIVFYAIALFCVMLTGNLVGSVLLTAFVNTLSLQIGGMIALLYMPLLRGVAMSWEAFFQHSPITGLIAYQYEDIGAKGVFYPDSAWGLLCIYLGVSVVLVAASWWLYRKRSLECAGDFLAFRRVGPVLTVLVAVLSGSMVYGFFYLFDERSYGKFVIGMAVAFFACQMLIRRTVRVFDRKTCICFGALLLAVALSLGITRLDPLGIISYVPDPAKIEATWIDQNGRYVNENASSPELNVRMVALHKAILEEKNEEPGSMMHVNLYYVVDGRKISRNYWVREDGEVVELLKKVSSRRELVLDGMDIEELCSDSSTIWAVCGEFCTKEDMGRIFDAIAKDCEEDHFWQIPIGDDAWDKDSYLDLYCARNGNHEEQVYYSFYVPREAQHTRSILRELGISK